MFEFLLEPGRLQQHLNSDNCDPSPTQLISLFLKNIPVIDFTSIPPDSYEAKYRAKKAYALETLALKVASFLNWDLDSICNNLTIPVQHKLMEALHSACLSSNCPKEVKQFADIIYHHWFLRSAINYQLSTLQPQSNNTTIIYLSQLQQQEQAANISALSSMGELFAPNSKHLNASSQGLHDYIKDLTTNNEQDCTNSVKRRRTATHPFKNAKLSRPAMDCFDSRDEQYNDWDKSVPLNSKEFLEEACYDLGRFFFFEENYDMAKQFFEIIKDSSIARFPKLSEYRLSSIDLIKPSCEENGSSKEVESSNGLNNHSHHHHNTNSDCDISSQVNEKRKQTEAYLFECMTQFSKSQKKESKMEIEEGEIEDDDEFEEDSDLRIGDQQNVHKLPPNSAWYLQVPALPQQQQLLEAAKGDMFMSQGNFRQAMGCFVGTLMLMTDYFRVFTKNYVDEEPYISRMIQCSISLSCFTQAVALCQMTRSINYTMAFKQLNERICNDCCADIYECIWNITLLEYIINLHAERGEVEMRTKVIQLIGQLELNENNPEDILKEAEHVRRGRFFRIMANKYL